MFGAAGTLAVVLLWIYGVLVLTARAALGTTGRPLTWLDQLLIAGAPIVADAFTGLPLRMLGLSSFAALFGRNAQIVPLTRSGRVGQQWIWGLASFSVVWLVVQTILGVNVVLPSQLNSFSSESVIMAVILAVLGGLGLTRHMPKSKADNGNVLLLEHFYWQRVAVFVGAIVTALFTPWVLWFGLGVTGLLLLVFDRFPHET